jgi:hypothetical protein
VTLAKGSAEARSAGSASDWELEAGVTLHGWISSAQVAQVIAVIKPTSLAEAPAPSRTENFLVSLNPLPVTDPNPIFSV